MNTTLTILVAAVLLLFGRTLYWFFVGAIGFLIGVQYASEWLIGQPEWLVFVVALGAGLVGALLAVLLQRVALAVAGFFGGGYFAMQLVQAFGGDADRYGILAFVVGGILAAILILVLLDPALIVLSSLVGASVIAQALPLEAVWQAVAFIALAALGIATQASLLYRYRQRAAPPTAG